MTITSFDFNQEIEPTLILEYTEAIMNDLGRLGESCSEVSHSCKHVIYFDYGFTPSLKIGIEIALSREIPIYYRRLGLVSPKYTNQWKEWPGCPKCGRMTSLRPDTQASICTTCGVEFSVTLNKWAPLNRGDGIKDLHLGQTAAILGGGPSLLSHWDALPPATALFGINHHAGRMRDICDYIVFNDERTWDFVKDQQGKKISRWKDKSDIHLPLLTPSRMSAILAVEIAQEMGFSHILLCGMDCSDIHCTGQPGRPDGLDKSPEWHLEKWKTLVDREGVYTLGGPTSSLFPIWPET